MTPFSSSQNRDGIRRGIVLETSQFLTQFGSQLDLPFCGSENNVSGNGKASSCVVSPQDIERALQYRTTLHELRKREDECYIATQELKVDGRDKVQRRQHLQSIEDHIEKLNQALQQHGPREKHVHQLLRRLEVWSTKAIAQEYMISVTSPKSAKEKRNDEQNGLQEDPSKRLCCSSPVLNLPTMSHFQQLTAENLSANPPEDSPATGADDDATDRDASSKSSSAFHLNLPKCCPLALPPNSYTWQAYGELLQMILRSDYDSTIVKRLLESPCTFSDGIDAPSASQTKKGTMTMYHPQFPFEAPDLLAVWIRAQRNTVGLRHLRHLFEIEDIGLDAASSSSMGDDDDHDSFGNKIRSSFRAVLKGNPPSQVKARIVDNSRLVDQLVEWTVVNQALYTYTYMQMDLRLQQDRRYLKRGSSANFDQRRRKRHKSYPTLEEDSTPSLIHACESYILRWFARRNSKVLSAVLGTMSSSGQSDLVSIKQEQNLTQDLTKEENIPDRAVEMVDAKNSNSLEETLTGIDDTLIHNRADNSGNFMRQRTLQALAALRESTADSQQVSAEQISAARRDFEQLIRAVLGDEDEYDVIEVAARLLDDTSFTGESEDTLRELLLKMPAPWSSRCHICLEGNSDIPLRTCSNCEKMCHARCATSKATKHLSDVIRMFPPLENLCRLKQPELPPPDFSRSRTSGNSQVIKWTTKSITIDRPVKNGRPMPLGLMLRTTEECKSVFDQLQPPTALVSNLGELMNKDKRDKRANYPLNIDHVGFVITDVIADETRYCGKTAGLGVGDVIVGLEIVSFLKPDEPSRYKKDTTYTFSKLGGEERMDLMRQKTTTVKLIVLRPSENIVQNGTDWYNKIKRLNRTAASACVEATLESESEARLWFCGNCLQSTDDTSVVRTVQDEARYCRAVLRRICLEAYAIPFFDETVPATKNVDDHNQFASLRRLDAMMSSIIASTQEDQSQNSQNNIRHREAPFCLPPEIAADPSLPERLHWAPPDLDGKPMELLCRGIGNIIFLETPDSEDLKREERKKLFGHFLSLFGSWCILPFKDSGNFSTNGPSALFQSIRSPWIKESCSVCCASAAVQNDESRRACSSIECNKILNEMDCQRQADTQEKETSKALQSHHDYACRASLVGTTVLFLPDDPLVEAVSKIVSIDHNDGPVEFIIASYLPPGAAAELDFVPQQDDLDQFEEGDGVYHLLPIVSTRQLTFLLERCVVRKPCTDISSTLPGGASWMSVDVLSLEGVARFSPRELEKKIEIHHSINVSIDDAVMTSLRLDGYDQDGDLRTKGETTFHEWSDDDPTISWRFITDSVANKCGGLFQKVLSSCAHNDEPRPLNSSQRGQTKAKEPPSDVVIKLLPPAEAHSRDCDLVYSDYCYHRDSEKVKLQEALSQLTLTAPEQHLRITDLKSIDSRHSTSKVLQSSDNSPQGALLGWGMEIIRWKHECVLRFGRVLPNQLAWRSGIRPHDIILGVNGKPVTEFKTQASIVETLVGRAKHGAKNSSSKTSTIINIKKLLMEDGNDNKARRVEMTIYRQGSKTSSSSKDSRQVVRNENLKSPPPIPVPDDSTAILDPSKIPVLRHEGKLPSEWVQLFKYISATYAKRPPVQNHHLYLPGPTGIVFTLVETAVFCGCLGQKQPLLGIRLLCPRYDLAFIMKQLKVLQVLPQGMSRVPTVPKEIHWLLLRADYERATNPSIPEAGDAVFIEGAHQYRMPVDKLPLDRLIEGMLEEHGTSNQLQHREYHNQWNMTHSTVGRREGEPASVHRAPRTRGILPEGYQRNIVQGPSRPDAQRIRGSGSSTTDTPAEKPIRTRLTTIPQHQWMQKAVYARVETKVDGRIGAYGEIIGFVKSVQTNAKEVPVVGIEAFYLTNIGYFKLPSRYEFESGHLFLIDLKSDSEKAKIVHKHLAKIATSQSPATLNSTATIPRSAATSNSATTIPRSAATSNSTATIPRPAVVAAAMPKQVQSALVQTAKIAVRRFSPISRLGSLPDGREVMWAVSDARALYVRTFDESFNGPLNISEYSRVSEKYKAILSKLSKCKESMLLSKEGAFPCVWGCCVSAESNMESLAFATLNDLKAHYVESHSFQEDIEITAFADEKGLFVRLSHGRAILELCKGLVAAVCAREPSFVPDTVATISPKEITQNGVIFYRSVLKSALSFPHQSSFMNKLRSCGEIVHPIIHLWLRLGRLFATEIDGNFRLSTDELDAVVCNDKSLPEAKLLSRKCACETETPASKVTVAESKNCGLCFLQSEAVEYSHVHVPPNNGGDIVADVSKHEQNIGCCLWGDINEALRTSCDCIPGHLGPPKAALLRIAAYIPGSLRLHERKGVIDPISGNRIWSHPNFDVWVQFVKESRNIAMLVQAFICLVTSVQTDRFPRWWRSKSSGWGSAQALTNSPTLSRLMLQLYIFDAALLECKCTLNRRISLSKKGEDSVSISATMQNYAVRASKISFPKFSGVHQETCLFCDDGGSLLCCELCNNVQHPHCCEPIISDPSVVESWICDYCINDIHAIEYRKSTESSKSS